MIWHKVIFQVGDPWAFRPLVADPAFTEDTEEGYYRPYFHEKLYNRSIKFITELRVPLDALDEYLRPTFAQQPLV